MSPTKKTSGASQSQNKRKSQRQGAKGKVAQPKMPRKRKRKPSQCRVVTPTGKMFIWDSDKRTWNGETALILNELDHEVWTLTKKQEPHAKRALKADQDIEQARRMKSNMKQQRADRIKTLVIEFMYEHKVSLTRARSRVAEIETDAGRRISESTVLRYTLDLGKSKPKK